MAAAGHFRPPRVIFSVLSSSPGQIRMIVPSLPVRRGLVAVALVLFVASMAGGFAQWPWGAFRVGFHGINHWASLEGRVRTPGTGLMALPIPVVGARMLLKRHGVTRYRLSDVLRQDGGMMQRMEEGLWPVRHDPDAAFVLAARHEHLGCERIDVAEGIALDRCR